MALFFMFHFSHMKCFDLSFEIRNFLRAFFRVVFLEDLVCGHLVFIQDSGA